MRTGAGAGGGTEGIFSPLLYIDIVNTLALVAQRGEDLKLQSNYSNNYHFRLHIFIPPIFVIFLHILKHNDIQLCTFVLIY